jgi:hypothetical protein
MKKAVLTSLLILFSSAPVEAFVFEPKVTNWADSTENSPGLGFFPLHQHPPGVESIDGGYFAWGTGFEFTLEQDMFVNSIKSPIAVSRGIVNRQPVPGTWTMNLTLYSGSKNQSHGQTLPNGQVVPNVNLPPLSENFIAHGHDLLPIGFPQGRVYTFQGVDHLHLELPAGTYWATYFDGAVVTYVQPRVQLKGHFSGKPVTTPEPASLFLVGGGLIGLLGRRRKSVWNA